MGCSRFWGGLKMSDGLILQQKILRVTDESHIQYGFGDFIIRDDGKVLATYIKWDEWNNIPAQIMLAVIDHPAYLWNFPNIAVENERLMWSTTYTGYPITEGFGAGGNSILLKVPNEDPDLPSKIFLFVFDAGYVGSSEYLAVFWSEDGTGDGISSGGNFKLINQNATTLGSGGKFQEGGVGCAAYSEGRILVSYMMHAEWSDGYTSAMHHVSRSDDYGNSWTHTRFHVQPSLVVFGGRNYKAGMCVADGGNISKLVSWSILGGYKTVVARSVNNGTSWAFHPNDPPLPYDESSSKSCLFTGKGDDPYNYFLQNIGQNRNILRRRLKSSPYTDTTGFDGWSGNIVASSPYYGNEILDAWTIATDIEADIVAAAGTRLIGSPYHKHASTLFIGNFTNVFAIATIAHDIIRSTHPYIPIIIAYSTGVESKDHLHFKLSSSKEEINSIDNPERFGYSMDGARVMKFPANGVPAVNLYGLIVWAKIEVAPSTSAALTPSTIVVKGAGSGKWWDIFDSKTAPDWINLGLDEGEDPEPWDSFFEHEVEGVEEEGEGE